MTSAQAQTYVAQVLGGANIAAKLAMALDSLKATSEMWTTDHDWHFLLFTQTISVVAGTSRYTLGGGTAITVFRKPFSMRFTGTLKHPLRYVPQELIDAVTSDQTVPGDPGVYTIIDDDANFDPDAEVQKVQLYPVPATNDTALLRYYRAFNGAATPIDVPLKYLYTFLDCARIHLLQAHDSSNPRLPILIRDVYGTRADAGRYQKAILDDSNEGGEAQWEGFVTPYDLAQRQTPQGPFDFWPRGDR